MARIEIGEVVLDKDGRPITGATVSVALASGGALATLYAAETGGTTLSNPLATVDGRVEAWVAQGSYDLIVAAGQNQTQRWGGYTQRFQAVDADNVGSGGGGGASGVAVKDAAVTIANRTTVRFLGSGGVGVAATDDGSGQATVTVGATPVTPGVSEVQRVGEGLLTGRSRLRFQASGGATLGVSDDGAGQSTITVAAASGIAATDANGPTRAGRQTLRFLGSGGATVGVSEDGNGQSTVTVAAASGVRASQSGGSVYSGRQALVFAGSGGVGVAVTDDGNGQSTVTVGPPSGGALQAKDASGPFYGGRTKLAFQASGGASIGVSDDGSGQSTVTVAASGFVGSVVGSAGVAQSPRGQLRFLGSGDVDVSVVDDGSGRSTVKARYTNPVRAWMPSGAVAATMSRMESGDNDISGALTTGRLNLVGGAVIPAGRTVSAITFVSGTTAASAPTNCWFCLVDLNRNVLAKTSDALTLAWGATATRTLLLSSAYTPTEDTPVYIGIMVKATTPPSLRGLSRSSSWVTAVGPPWPAAYADTGLTTPASLGATTAALTGDTATALAWLS